MDTEKFKIVEIDSRKFIINKINPKTSLKLAKLILLAGMPGLNCFTKTKNIIKNIINNPNSIDKDKMFDDIVDNINLENIFEALQKCLLALSDNDLDKVIDWSLTSCSEILPAGNTPVLNFDGTYGVADIENDLFMVVALTAKVLEFNFKGFFNDSRWNSLLKASTLDTQPRNV